jgi:hypothetical protein
MININELVRCPIQLRTVKKDTLDYMILKEAIRAHGILTPLVVRPTSDGYEVVDGMRRLEVALDERMDAVPCNIKELTDGDVDAVQLILNPGADTISIARRLAKIIRREKDITVNELAHLAKQHPDWVFRNLGMKNLVPRAKEMVKRDRLPASVVVELAKLPPVTQNTILESHGSVPFDALADAAQTEVRNLRAGARDQRRLDNYEREYRADAKSKIEVWNSCLDWVLKNDLASLAKNQQSQTGESYE